MHRVTRMGWGRNKGDREGSFCFFKVVCRICFVKCTREVLLSGERGEASQKVTVCLRIPNIHRLQY
jgi:hypothetical protein